MSLPVTDQISGSHISTSVKTIVAIFGLGFVPFTAGYMSQSALFDFVGVPFAFVDYWSHVETGMTVWRESLYALFTAWPIVAAGILGVVVAILSTNFESVRRLLSRPWGLMLAVLLELLLIGLLLRQHQRVERLLRPEVSLAQRLTKVPLTEVFSFGVGPVAQPPKDLPVSALKSCKYSDLWTALAKEATRLDESEKFLLVRPSQPWEVPCDPDDLASAAIFGRKPKSNAVPVAEACRQLYRNILVGSFLAGLGLFMVWRWESYIARGRTVLALGAGDEDTVPEPGEPIPLDEEALRKGEKQETKEDHKARRALIWESLQDEIWWAVRKVLLPFAFVGLGYFIIALLPRDHALLYTQHIGHERVEMLVSKDTGSSKKHDLGDDAADDSASSTESAAESSNDKNGQQKASATDQDQLLKLSVLADRYSLAEIRERKEQLDEWRSKLHAIATHPSLETIRFLGRVENMTSTYAPDLADVAHEFSAEMQNVVTGRYEGYMLFHSRSPDESTKDKSIRLLRKIIRSGKPDSWEIVSMPMTNLKSLALVSRDSAFTTLKDLALADRQGHPMLDTNERRQKIIDLETQGFKYHLEACLVASLDPSADIANPEITSLARYVQGLSRTAFDDMRRKRALAATVAIFDDPYRDSSARGAAATTIHRIAAGGEDTTEAGAKLINFLSADARLKNEDPHWIIAGTTITALGQLKEVTAIPRLLSMFANATVPSHLRSAIPAALDHFHEIGKNGEVLKALSQPMVEPSNYDQSALLTSISALGELLADANALRKQGGAATEAETQAFTTMKKFLYKVGEDPRFVGKLDALDRCQTGLMNAIMTGCDPRGDNIFAQVLHDRAQFKGNGGYPTVAEAAKALMFIEIPEAEGTLVEAALDSAMPDSVRGMALKALGEYHGDQALEAIDANRAEFVNNSELREIFVKMLTTRGDQGSGAAKRMLKQLLQYVQLQRLRQLIENFNTSKKAPPDVKDTELSPSKTVPKDDLSAPPSLRRSAAGQSEGGEEVNPAK